MIRDNSGGVGGRVDALLLGHAALPHLDRLLTTFPNDLERNNCCKWPQNGLFYRHGE